MDNTGKQFRKRNAILACLRQSKAHPSAEALYQSLRQEYDDISLATVYRNLALFKEQGLIVSLGTVDGIERFDGRLDPHIHFGCTRCHRVSDIENADLLDRIPTAAADSLGCRVDTVQLMLSGVCKDCLNNQSV